MARKFVCHSLLVALTLVVVCSAAPAPAPSPLLLTDPDPASLGSLGTTGLDPTNLLASPDAFGPDLDALDLTSPSNFLSGGGGFGSFAFPIQVAGTGGLVDPGLTSDLLSGGGDLANPAFTPDLLSGGLGKGLDSLVAPPGQIVPSQTVQLTSETEVIPTTRIHPNLIFQPAIQLFDPLVNNVQTPGVGPAYTNGFAGSGRFGLASFKKRQLGRGPLGTPGPIGGPGGSPPTIVNGTPTDVSTDTLIQPIVNIQPHALQPVPVPVSQPYNYPVPVGVSVPVGPVGPVGGGGCWGGDCDWGKRGGGWRGGDCGGWGCNSWGSEGPWSRNSWGGGGPWGGSSCGGGQWGDDCDWDWGFDNDWSW
ncbi:hypothetical protein EC957_006978 [Mortierella hygrophila]|uniref:Uncharacterized protein n=1 Tax=Mortierella hygrophila TaxID=979708 RepID=A0A9P6K655_9FUNG|nr:hypothetical protein EC957_006978 [Mortierella hygrophila]